MTEIIVEPSEIITKDKYVHTKPTGLYPWIRFLARLVDYCLFCLVLLGIKTYFHTDWELNLFKPFIPWELFAWIPIEALLLFFFGTTPGKWFLKTRLFFGRKKKPELILALRRSLSVWWRGLGMGIVVISALCLLVAYNRLKMTQTTSWDREDHISVIHNPLPKWRLAAATLFVLGSLLLF